MEIWLEANTLNILGHRPKTGTDTNLSAWRAVRIERQGTALQAGVGKNSFSLNPRAMPPDSHSIGFQPTQDSRKFNE